MDSISCTSHSKVNLFLEILGKRSDGYHEICTLFQEISLGDEVAIRKINEEYSVLKCNDATVPFGRRNLCIKAYDIVRENTPLNETVEITLDKRVPLGAGLGGGSSNGACIIRSLNELYCLGMDTQAMADLAARAGSDVPFFIYGGTAMGRGRGEVIHKLPSLPSPIWLVVVKPAASVSTGNAYQWVKGYKGKRELDMDKLSERLRAGDVDYIISIMYNAFEPIVLEKCPELGRYKQELEQQGCLKAMLTGCGSAFYGICRDRAHAEETASFFTDREDVTLSAACHTI